MNKRLYHISILVLLVLFPLLSYAGPPAGTEKAGKPKIVINIPSRTLWLYYGDKIDRWYPVGVGRGGFATPVGMHKVTRMVKNPVWEHPYKPAGAIRIGPGVRNPLGTRWIGFRNYKGGEYGIHGTDNPSSVGRFVSHGCIRMRTPDAEELFKLVEVGTPVEIRYDLALIRRHGDRIRIATYRDALGRGKPTVAEIKERILARFPNAEVDDVKIRYALNHPVEQYMAVGSVMPVLPDGDEIAGTARHQPDSEPARPESAPDTQAVTIDTEPVAAKESPAAVVPAEPVLPLGDE